MDTVGDVRKAPSSYMRTMKDKIRLRACACAQSELILRCSLTESLDTL